MGIVTTAVAVLLTLSVSNMVLAADKLVLGVQDYGKTPRVLAAEFKTLATYLLLRPYEVLSGIANPPVLEVGHNALRGLLQHRHVVASRLT